MIQKLYFNKPFWNLFIKNILITEVNKVLMLLKTLFPSVTPKLSLYLSKDYLDKKSFKVIYSDNHFAIYFCHHKSKMGNYFKLEYCNKKDI